MSDNFVDDNHNNPLTSPVEIDVDNIDDKEIKRLEASRKKAIQEKKARLNNTDEKIEKLIKSINRLITNHIKSMKIANESIKKLIENEASGNERGIISQEKSVQTHKLRMDKINLLLKAFDTTELEREFNETKKNYG